MQSLLNLSPFRSRVVGPGLVAVGLAVAAVRSQGAGPLFSETFNGYTNFPSQIPSGDYVNPGLPVVSEGANAFWYGVRFQTGTGTIDSDLAVQKVGGSGDATPVGRFEDDAGLVLRIDTTGYENVNLAFDWRTFLAESSDRFTVGYHVGDDLGFDTSANRYRDLTGTWPTSWTQLLSASASNAFSSENFALPSNAGPIYVAFWMNNGEGDYGKLDNVLITGTLSIPEPGSTALAALAGALWFGWWRRCHNRR
jgi:hypothetical protein